MFQFNRENVNVNKFQPTLRSIYLIYVPCVFKVYFLDQTVDNIYIYINNVVISQVLLHVSMHPHNLQAALFFNFAILKLSQDFTL